MSNRKHVFIFDGFEKTVRKRYPFKSMYEITKELNDVLEKMLGYK